MGLKSYYNFLKELPPSVNFKCTYKQKELNSTSIDNQMFEDDIHTNNSMDDKDNSPHDNQISQSTVISKLSTNNTGSSSKITVDGM